MKPSRLLTALVGFVSTVALSIAAAPPTTKVALKLAVPRTSSNFVVSADRSALLWAGREGESGYVYAASLSTGRVCLLYELPADVSNASEIMLRAVPANSDRLVVGFASRGVTGGWDLYVLALDEDNDEFITELTGPSDGNVALSPSGLYVAAGTGFTCFGGGLDCSAQSVGVFSVDDGQLELSLDVPSRLVHDPADSTEAERESGGRRWHQEATLEGFWWCDNDVLTVRSSIVPYQVFHPSPDRTWPREAGPSPCPAPRNVRQDDSTRVQSASVAIGSVPLEIRWEPERSTGLGNTRYVTVSVTIAAPTAQKSQ